MGIHFKNHAQKCSCPQETANDCPLKSDSCVEFDVVEAKAEIKTHYLLQFFKYEHLPEELQPISHAFAGLAGDVDRSLPDNPEKTTALRKLLEAKDCAVRAKLFKDGK